MHTEVGRYLSRRPINRPSIHPSTVCTQVDVEHVVDRGVFEVNTEQACYEMSLSVSVCPGVFYRTKQVTVAPRFVVVNCMDAEVALRQTGEGASIDAAGAVCS